MVQTIDNLIEFSRSTLEGDGLGETYIKNLSYTWNAFKDYLNNTEAILSRDTGKQFLIEKYGMQFANIQSGLSAVDKRRNRAINILLNCLEHGKVRLEKTYWPCSFSDPFSKPFEDFVYNRKNQGLALSTVNRDIYCLNKFSKYLQQSNITSFSMINGVTVIGFMKWISIARQLPTLKSVSASLRLLLKHLHINSYLSKDYSKDVPVVKVHKSVPSVYTSDEIEQMINSFNRKSNLGIRNYAMVLLAVRLGMRSSDICNLEFKNIHWDRNTIEFTTRKTGKHTVLPLTAELGNAIIHYLQKVRPPINSPQLFMRFQKPYAPLKPSILHSIVTQAFHDAGIIIPAGKRHGAHALRASLAGEMLKKDVPLPVISEVLSHSNLNTTKIYLKIDIPHLRILALEVPGIEGVWMGGERL